MRLLLLALVAAAGCVTYNPREPVPVVDEGPDWARQAVAGAAAFWSRHQVAITVGDHGIGVRLGTSWYDGDPLALYYYTDGNMYLAERLAEARPVGAACVVAHELGHAIGLQHVEPGADGRGSLMQLRVGVLQNDCSWSEYDQAELDRVRGDR